MISAETPRGRYIASLVEENGFILGAELGVKEGKTLETILAYSECCMIAVDTWAPRSNELESYDNWDFGAFEEQVRQVAAHYPGRVTIIQSSTHEAAKEVAYLDFVFIDADHSHEGVRADIRDWSPKVREGGLVIGHDWDWPSVRRAAEEAFTDIETGPDNLWISRLSV